ncbi:hypothetical protein SteCoe_21915 [Stentor coeruleus]|uniref:Uncharacterized protein n=1 Tax=Stentor coeruleus TaxID=5963 RepID=A0A1R2BNI7_9CILI|nr:hypothetical protein SteCoe_21915 [Stentor coeruleus]
MHIMIIKELNSYENRPCNADEKPKVFPYIEKYYNNYSPKGLNFPLSPSHLANLNYNPHKKVLKNKYNCGYIHSRTLRYDNPKQFNSKFIELKDDFEGNNDYVEQKRMRSTSEMYQNSKDMKNTMKFPEIGNCAIIPSIKAPQSVRINKGRRTSIVRNRPEQQKIEIPFAKPFPNSRYATSGYFGEFEHSATRDVSIDTNL